MSPEDQKTVLEAAQEMVSEYDLYDRVVQLKQGAPGDLETSATLSSTVLKALIMEILVHRERQGVLSQTVTLSGKLTGEVN